MTMTMAGAHEVLTFVSSTSKSGWFLSGLVALGAVVLVAVAVWLLVRSRHRGRPS